VGEVARVAGREVSGFAACEWRRKALVVYARRNTSDFTLCSASGAT